jgi:ribose 5-phosphate isomerase B
MRIVIASDHAGLALKQCLVPQLSASHEVIDLGTHNGDSVDYPLYGQRAAEAVVDGRADRGIVICGSGIGIAIAANKVRGCRASVCHDTYSARVAVEHNDLNVLALGGRVIGPELAWDIVKAYLNAKFAGGRHQNRVDMITELDKAR